MNDSHMSSQHASTPPVRLPEGYVGPVRLPGTQREIWWTGRVAIGLRYERPHAGETETGSHAWLQDLLLRH